MSFPKGFRIPLLLISLWLLIGCSPNPSSIVYENIHLPLAPSSVRAEIGDGEIRIWWVPERFNVGDDAVTRYLVVEKNSGKSCERGKAGDFDAELSCVITDLHNDSTYAFNVYSFNISLEVDVCDSTKTITGRSCPSQTVFATPRAHAPPGAPTSPTAVAGNAHAVVSWTPGFAYYPANLFTATSVQDTSRHCSALANETSCIVTGLTNGSSYTFTVVAANAFGSSPASVPTAAVTPVAPAGAPTGVTAVAGVGEATVSWNAPASDGGTPITGYKAMALSDTTKSCITTTALTCTITGLNRGTTYIFQVRPLNALGGGALSELSPSVTTFDVPGIPTGLGATAGNGQATLSWTAPTSNGGSPITGYKVVTVSDTTLSCTAVATTCTVTGLSNGTSYTFSVRAINAVGGGMLSSASAAVTPFVPATAPQAPDSLIVEVGNAQATLSWKAPAFNGGAAITGYRVRAVGDSTKFCTTNGALTCIVAGLTNGTPYTFVVTATNSVGRSPASLPSDTVTPFIPINPPGAPTAVIATISGSDATVSWTAPASDGGAAISSYTAVASPGGAFCVSDSATPATSCTINGLTFGVRYTFTVSATNVRGMGPSSSSSAAATPVLGTNLVAQTVGTYGYQGAWTHEGRILFVGPGGYVMSSTDNGNTWTTRTSATNKGLERVQYAVDKWVAIGNSGAIETSADGVSWSFRTSGTTRNLAGLAHSDSLWVTVGDSGTILSSPNGITWSPQTSGTLQHLKAVTWTGSEWVATGLEGTVLTSPDGLTWTKRASPTGTGLYDVTWTGTKLMAIGLSGALFSSTNGGVSWTSAVVPINLIRMLWISTSATPGEGQLVLMGGGGTLVTVAEGSTVTQPTGTTKSLQSATWTGTRLVVSGLSGTLLITP